MAKLDDARAESLRSIAMFADLDDVALSHVFDLATEVDVANGFVLLQPGQEGSGMFVILDGKVNVELPGGTTITCSQGEFIGELSLLVDGLVHTGRVRAASPVKCLAIGRDDFMRLVDTYPQIAVSMLKVLARRLADTDEMLRSH
ncbi:MAG TPA: cyclic nucleotide-binding domain-containing protein [Acidimicrobiia bacterium]|jgi:CRP-like cAMP-binding protein|nr:cyclic nucleotide-binding domain-containing protein [Acidimicrobiia bacterium]